MSKSKKNRIMYRERITDKNYILNNGTTIPAIGLGTYRVLDSDTMKSSVDAALAAGYRMFDTAEVYKNEIFLKDAFKSLLAKYGLDREDIFIITKVAPPYKDIDLIKRSCEKSLSNLGLDYVDLYLVQFPGSLKISRKDPKQSQMRHIAWEALMELYDDGKANAIGVSNFNVPHLEDLMSRNYDVVPAVNQVEWHPYYHQKELLEYCRKNEILLQAYSSLGGTSTKNYDLIQDPTIVSIAKKLYVSPAQVLLAWAAQQEICLIPKATNPDYIKENVDINFRISVEDMNTLSRLGKHQKYAWDPSRIL